MPITLAEASVGRADKVTQEVIDTLRRGSQFMMPYHRVSEAQLSPTVTYSSRHRQQRQAEKSTANTQPMRRRKLKRPLTLKSSAVQVRLTVLFRKQQQTKLRFSSSRKPSLLVTIFKIAVLTAQRLISRLTLTVLQLSSRAQAPSTTQALTRQ